MTFRNQTQNILASLCLSACLIVTAKASFAQDDNVQRAIDVIVLFCLAGGTEEVITEVVSGQDDLVLTSGGRSIEVRRFQVQGLADGLVAEMSSISSEQADRARSCMEPYINKVISVLIPRDSGSSLFDIYQGHIRIIHGTDGDIIYDGRGQIDLSDGFAQIGFEEGGRTSRIGFEIRGDALYVSGWYRGLSDRTYVIEGRSVWNGDFSGRFRMIRPDRRPHIFEFSLGT